MDSTKLRKLGIFRDFLLFISIFFFLVILVLVGDPKFETNDDMAIIGIISGANGQTPYVDGIFISVLHSSILFLLYSIFPIVPWYSLLLYLFQLISCFLLVKIVIRSRVELSGKILTVIAFACIYSYIFYRLNFTSTAILLWASACAFIIQLNMKKIPISKVEWLLGLMLGLSFLLRSSIYYLYFFLFIPVLFSFYIYRNKRRMLQILLTGSIVIGVGLILNFSFRTSEEMQTFSEFNQARSQFKDTSLSVINKNTNDALQRINWSWNEYHLAQMWYMHNEEVFNARSLRDFLIYNEGEKAKFFSFKNAIQKLLGDRSYYEYLIIIIVVLGLLLSSNSRPYELNGKEKKLSNYFYTLFFIGLAFSLFALAGIRLPMRIFLPLIFYSLLLFLIVKPLFSIQIRNKFGVFFKVSNILASLVLCFYMIERINELSIESDFKQYFEESIQDVIELNGSETVFIQLRGISYTQNVNPLNEYNEVLEYKKLPGGWLIGSPVYYDFIQKLGYDNGEEIITKSINNENIVYVHYQRKGEDFKETQNQIVGHFEKYYQINTNGKIKISIVLDQRYKEDNQKVGLIYFKVKQD